jgi:hypothetical protein
LTGGTLPQGLTFSNSGAIGGVPSASSQGSYSVTFRVTDADLRTTQVTLGITVNPAPVVNLPELIVGVPANVPAGAGASGNAQNLLLGSWTFQAIHGNAAISGLNLTFTGTANPASTVQNLRLFVDTNGNGVCDQGEPQLGTNQPGAANVSFTFPSLAVSSNQTVRLLLIANLQNPAADGVTVRYAINAANAVTSVPGAGSSTPSPVTGGFPLSTTNVTLSPVLGVPVLGAVSLGQATAPVGSSALSLTVPLGNIGGAQVTNPAFTILLRSSGAAAVGSGLGAGPAISIAPTSVVPATITVNGGQTVAATLTFNLPGAATAGIYTVDVSVTATSVGATVSDSDAATTGRLEIFNQVAITTTVLPQGTTGVPYQALVSSTGGAGTRQAAVTAGTLPTGLVIAPNGLITGNPTATGSFNFTVTVADTGTNQSSRPFSITVVAPPAPPPSSVGTGPAPVVVSVITSALPQATILTPYAFTMSSSPAGGTWSLVSGALPTGLTLDTAAGRISGTPTISGSFNLGVRYTAAGGAFDTRQLALTVRGSAQIGIDLLPAGAASGINIRSSATTAASVLRSIDGAPVSGASVSPEPLINYVDIASDDTTGPRVIRAVYLDIDNSGTITAGDVIRTVLNEPIQLVSASIGDFTVDAPASLGTGATLGSSQGRVALDIVLGAGASFTPGTTELRLLGLPTGLRDLSGNPAIPSSAVIEDGTQAPVTVSLLSLNGEPVEEQSSVNIDWITTQESSAWTIGLELLQGGQPVAQIASGLANTGRYNWTIPEGLTGLNYRVRISGHYSTLNLNVTDQSALAFEIVPFGALAGAGQTPTVRFASPAFVTPDESSATYNVPVILSSPAGALTSPLTVQVRDTGVGSATAGVDYTFVDTSLTFPIGSTSGTILNAQISVIQDTEVEGDENVILELTAASEESVGLPALFSLTITDDDFLTPAVVVREGTDGPLVANGSQATNGRAFSSRVALDETSPRITISLSNTGSAPLTLGPITINGHDADFQLDATGVPSSLAPAASTSFTLTFAPVTIGLRTATVSFTHNGGNTGTPFSFQITGEGLTPFAATTVNPATNTTAIVSGDFNRDGRPDLLIGSTTGLALRLSDATGLASPLNVAAGSGHVLTIATADFNRDGNPDAVIGFADGTIQILHGTGTGSFTAGPSANLSGLSRILLADLTRNGFPDIVALAGNAVSVFPVTGTGIGSPTGHSLTDTGVDMVLADFTTDGRPDIAVGLSNGSLNFLRGTSAGFASAELISLGLNTIGGLAAADLERNADPDLLVSGTDSNGAALVILPGLGAAGFGSAVTIPFAGSAGRIAVADTNLDGRSDVLVTQPTGVRLLRGNATGGLTDAGTLAASSNATRIAVMDLNRDGRPDLAFATDTATGVLVNNLGTRPAPSFTVGSPTNAGSNASPVALAVADWNQDGFPDLIAANGNGSTLSILLTNQAGVPLFDTSLQSGPANSNPVAVVTADLNKDGVADTIAANRAAGSVTITYGSQVGAPQITTLNVGNQPVALVTGDFNRNGWTDLAVVLQGGNAVAILLNDGTGNLLTPPQLVALPAGSQPSAIAAADFDRDGITDLAVSLRSTAQVLILTGNGLGNFTTSQTIAVGTAPVALVTGDFDRDGQVDLAVLTAGSGTVAASLHLLLSGTGGTLTSATPIDLGIAPSVDAVAGLVAADLDRDGRIDLVIGARQEGRVIVLHGDGQAGFTTSSVTTGGPVNALAIADFNRDGRPDIATASTTTGTIRILTGN